MAASGLASLGDPAKDAKLKPDLIARTEAHLGDMVEAAAERSRLGDRRLHALRDSGRGAGVSLRAGLAHAAALDLLGPGYFGYDRDSIRFSAQ